MPCWQSGVGICAPLETSARMLDEAAFNTSLAAGTAKSFPSALELLLRQNGCSAPKSATFSHCSFRSRSKTNTNAKKSCRLRTRLDEAHEEWESLSGKD